MTSPPPDAGLCTTCRHAAAQRSARASTFWRCRRAERDPTWPRYPSLPVRQCRGHEPAPSAEAGPGPEDSGNPDRLP